MKKSSIYLSLAISVLLQIKLSSAYIDPGTGTAIVSSAWPAIVGIIGVAGAFLARIFISPIKKVSGKLWGKIRKQ